MNVSRKGCIGWCLLVMLTVLPALASSPAKEQTYPALKEEIYFYQDVGKLVYPVGTDVDGKGANPAESVKGRGWIVLLAEGFEGAFPGPWDVYDADGITNGEYYWDDTSCNPHSGSWASWCADGGADGYYSCVDAAPVGEYANDMESWLIFGPFDLSDATEAEVLFSHWTITEADYDAFIVAASTDGVNWGGWVYDGDWVAGATSPDGYRDDVFDLTNVGGWGDLCGEAEVWIVFFFASDSSITYRGTYLDDIVVRKNVPECCDLSINDWWFEQGGSVVPLTCLDVGPGAPDATLFVQVENWCSFPIDLCDIAVESITPRGGETLGRVALPVEDARSISIPGYATVDILAGTFSSAELFEFFGFECGQAYDMELSVWPCCDETYPGDNYWTETIDTCPCSSGREWTVMVYLNGDNNLEGAAIDDLNEMEAAGSSDCMTVLAQIDRIPGYDTSNGDWTGTRRYYVTQDPAGYDSVIRSDLLMDLGEVDMGDPSELADFACWGIANFPAEHYALVVWDHGGGWKMLELNERGISWDDSALSYMSMLELEEALAQVYDCLDRPIDVVGYDACLMAMAEVDYASAPYADYRVASEDSEPNDGWDYQASLGWLRTNCLTATPAQFARQIAADYVAFYGPSETQSAVDLSQSRTTSVSATVDALASYLQFHLPTLCSVMESARATVREYADSSFIDLYHFAQLVHGGTSDVVLKGLCNDVMTAVTTAVIANYGGANDHGISIYFPPCCASAPYDCYYDTSYETQCSFTLGTHWDELLQAYYSHCCGDDLCAIDILSIDTNQYCATEKIYVNVFVDTVAGVAGALTSANFSIFEDGVEQPITSFHVVGDDETVADIVFVFDDTGSMGGVIVGMKAGVNGVVDAIEAAGVDARYSLVSFKDEPELDLALTADAVAFKAAVNALVALEGGDGPEDDLDALMDYALTQSFRPGVQKIIIDITDAPTHYLGDGSGFASYTMPQVEAALRAVGVIFIAISPDFRASPMIRNNAGDLVRVIANDEGDKRVLAEELGGLWIDIHGADFSVILDEVVETLSNYYIIDYVGDCTPGAEVGVIVEVTDPVAGTCSDSGSYICPPCDEFCEAITCGLGWLADQQDPTTGAWNLGYYPVTSTAFAVLKLAHHAVGEVCSEIIDPFDPAYEYSDEIEAGLRYLFERAICIDINPEPAGNPDVNLVNGKGIYFLSLGTNRPLYETGIVMMALRASCHPERIVDAPGSCVHGWTYLDVMRDTVDYIAWAQNDEPNVGRGGWRYGAYDNGIMVSPGFAAPDSDNSLSQWPVLGLLSAAEWDVNAPRWVKSELLNHWLDYSQDATTGCFGYAAPGSFSGGGPFAVTAAGLIQLTYCGVTTDDSRWAAAANCICTNWDNKNIGNIYAMYGLMKAAMLAQPETVWDFCGHEWYAEYTAWLLNAQNSDCSWNADGYYADQILATEWALLILQKVAPEPPDPCGPMTVSASDVRALCGSTDWTTVSVDTLPTGLAGYIITLELESAGCARFTGSVEFMNPGAAGLVDSWSDYSITFRDTDFGNVVNPGATDVDLAQVEVECIDGDCNCEVVLRVQVDRLEDDGGSVADPCTEDGLVSCGDTHCPVVPFPDPAGPINVLGPAQDLDGDGDCEDINGDGTAGFIDAILLSYNVGAGDPGNPINLCPSCFDFSCNGGCGSPCDGMVGFVDAICHAWTEVGVLGADYSPAAVTKACDITVSASGVPFDEVGETQTTILHASGFPTGLSGYIITLTLDPAGSARFNGDVSFLSPGAAGRIDYVDEYTITFRDTDFGSAIQPGATDIDLAQVGIESVQCPIAPAVVIGVTVDRLEDDSGTLLTPCVANGIVTCGGSCSSASTELTPAGWQMIALPGDLCGGCGADVATFGDLCCAICDDVDPCFIFRFDPTTSGYAMVPPCDSIDYEAGMGFWIRTYEDPIDIFSDVTLITTTRCIQLETGWNQIGNPFNFEIALSNVTIQYGGDDVSLLQAQNNGWVSMFLFGYDAAAGGYAMLDPATGTLEPWKGYWLRAYVDCEICVQPSPAPPAPPASVRSLRELTQQGIPVPPPHPMSLPMVEAMVSELEVRNVPNPVRSEHTTTFKVQGDGAAFVEAILLRIYDLGGVLVYEQEVDSTELDWHTDNSVGELLANGTYLSQILVKIDDVWHTTGIQKVVVLR